MARIDAELSAPRGTMPCTELANPWSEALTLLDLVQAVAEFAETDAEVAAVVEHLLETGRVLLTRPFQGAELLTN